MHDRADSGVGAPVSGDSGRLWGSGLFAGALALRLVHLLTIRDSPFFSILYIDPLMYDEWGQRIASGVLVSARPFFLDPLYPYFLGAIYAVFGHHYEAVVAVQSILGALVAPLTYLAARRWYGEPAARAAGLIAAIYLPSIYFGGLIMKPGLSMALVALFLWLMSRNLAEPVPLPRWWLSGLVLGLAVLNRGNLLLALPPIVAWVLLRTMPPGQVGLRRVREALCLTAGVAPLLALSLAHNVAVSGEWILTTANAGANFYIGNNPTNTSGEYQQLPFIRANPKWEQLDFAAEAARRSGRSAMTDAEISHFWFRESFRWIRENPRAWIGLLWSKLRAFWGAFENPDSVDYYLYREYAAVLRLPIPGFGLLAPLALVGAWLSLRRPGWPRLLLVLLAAYMATVVAFFVFSRFRVVVAQPLFVFAGDAAVELWRRWRGGARDGREAARRPALGLTLALVGAFVFVNLPVRARPDTWGFRVAQTVGWPTRLESSALGHQNLGLAYARDAKTRDTEANLQAAERELRIALATTLEPQPARTLVELGKVLARQHRNREAIELYRRALVYEPGNPRIHHALGLLLRREGDLDAAADEFRKGGRFPNDGFGDSSER